MKIWCSRYWLWQCGSVYRARRIKRVAHETQIYNGSGMRYPTSAGQQKISCIFPPVESRSLISYARVYRGTDVQLPRVAMNFCSGYGSGALHPSLYSPKVGVIDIVLIMWVSHFFRITQHNVGFLVHYKKIVGFQVYLAMSCLTNRWCTLFRLGFSRVACLVYPILFGLLFIH